MPFTAIPPERLTVDIFDLWDNHWFLLFAGDWEKRRFNTMTVSWGSLGVLWNKPFAQVVVRPTRHTYQFIEQHDSFTLCAFPARYREAMQLLGSRSGRDGDKIKESRLTPMASTVVAAPSFAEADLILECRKIYWDDLEPGHFLLPEIDKNYPQKDYHRIYFGEILAVLQKQS